jgi:CubicO group peptidase (beta-lactamase class C family)
VCFASLSVQAARAGDAPDPGHPEIQGALLAIDAWLDGEQAFRRIPGMSVGVVLDQELIWKKGYGYSNVEGEVPADENTIYSICSISKLFTSIGVMQLRDQGKLRLKDPVADHLDWYDLPQVHDGGPVTIEGILTHSSGLPREADFVYWNEPDFAFPRRDSLVEALEQQETLYPAQTYFQYSNLGLSLAGEIAT